MGAPGHLGKDHVGPAPPHLGGRCGRQEIRVGAPDQRERQALAGVEQRPEIGGLALEGGEEGLAQRRVIGDAQPLRGLGVVELRLGQPALRRHVREAGHELRQGRRQLGMGGGRGVAADIGKDLLEARPLDLGPHVVQAEAPHPVLDGRGEEHAHQPAARGAEDGRRAQAQMVEKLHRVARLARNGVGGGPGEVRAAPSAIVRPDQPDAGQVRRQIVEVGAGPGESREAQERQALALVGEGQAGTVARGEELGHGKALVASVGREPCTASPAAEAPRVWRWGPDGSASGRRGPGERRRHGGGAGQVPPMACTVRWAATRGCSGCGPPRGTPAGT